MWTSPVLPQSAHSGAISLFHVHSYRSLERFRLDSKHSVIVGIERNLNRRITFWKSRQVEPCTVVPRDFHAIYIYVSMALAQSSSSGVGEVVEPPGSSSFGNASGPDSSAASASSAIAHCPSRPMPTGVMR